VSQIAAAPLAEISVEVDRDIILDLHRRMVRIRLFEDQAGKLMERGTVPGFLHLYTGQEAVAAGACSVLTDGDQITSTHRGHGHAIAKGATFRRMFAELYGRVDGYCLGRGGSMHINDLSIGMLGANGIVGGGLPIAVGAAFASVYKGSGTIAMTFFGDGTSNIGAFHESANLAAVWNLPVVFLCENNGYAEYTAQHNHMKLENVADRAAAYGMPGVICDGMDAMAVRETVREAVDRARDGGGPTLVEAKTYRYFDHQGIKGLRVPYRTQEEIDDWKSRDAIDLIELRAIEAGLVSREAFDAVWDETRADIEDGMAFADASPHPDPADIFLNVYSD
jgi:TPP-dependent pyruvate/acetoin dehydrogenase alpha subunit